MPEKRFDAATVELLDEIHKNVKREVGRLFRRAKRLQGREERAVRAAYERHGVPFPAPAGARPILSDAGRLLGIVTADPPAVPPAPPGPSGTVESQGSHLPAGAGREVPHDSEVEGAPPKLAVLNGNGDAHKE